eukprot:m.430898 g.430898  ORF g.430898 m.430898 type:complete len:103 (+) comp17227_c0_seq1:3104-3412(+)
MIRYRLLSRFEPGEVLTCTIARYWQLHLVSRIRDWNEYRFQFSPLGGDELGTKDPVWAVLCDDDEHGSPVCVPNLVTLSSELGLGSENKFSQILDQYCSDFR